MNLGQSELSELTEKVVNRFCEEKRGRYSIVKNLNCAGSKRIVSDLPNLVQRNLNKIFKFLNSSPDIWEPFVMPSRLKTSALAVLDFFSKVNLLKSVKNEFPIYQDVQDRTLRLLTKQLHGYVLMKDPEFQSIFTRLIDISKSPFLSRAIEAYNNELKNREESNLISAMEYDWEEVLAIKEKLQAEIGQANEIRKKIISLPFVKLLKLIKPSSMKSNIVRTNQTDKKSPIQKYYPKMREMVNEPQKDSLSMIKKKEKKLRENILKKRRRFGWNMNKSIFNSANPKNIVKMERKAYFNNKRLNNFDYVNKNKSSLGKEIMNFMNQRKKRFFEFNIKKSEAKKNANEGGIRGRINEEAMRRMRRLMKRSMFDINFK